MSTDPIEREIRQWLDVVSNQLNEIDIRLGNVDDPMELTDDGETAYRYLVQARQTLERGSMIFGDAVRRALDLFMLGRRRAYRRRSDYPQPTTGGHQEPSGQPHTRPSDGTGPSNLGPHPVPSRNGTEGEVNTTYLIWESQIVDADGDPADVTMTQQWITYENGLNVWNGFLVDRSGIPVHIPPHIDRGRVRRLCVPRAPQLRRG